MVVCVTTHPPFAEGGMLGSPSCFFFLVSIDIDPAYWWDIRLSGSRKIEIALPPLRCAERETWEGGISTQT